MKNKKKKMWFGIFSILLLLLYNFPFFTVNFFEWNKPYSTKVKAPNYVTAMSDYVNTQTPLNTRIMLMPTLRGSNNPDIYSWGYFSLDPLPELTMKRSIIYANDNSLGATKLINTFIGKGDEQSFLQTAQQFGINKILWRDDSILAEDKKISKDYAFLEDNLKNFKKISLEKSFGPWRLYAIQDSIDNFISVPSRLQSSSLPPSDFYKNQELIGDSSVISDEGNNIPDNFEPFLAQKALNAQCVYCNEIEKENMYSEFRSEMETRFLPDSIFYSFTKINEYLALHKSQTNKQKAELYINLSNKRLGEIISMANRGTFKNTDAFIAQAIVLYKQEIDSAIVSIEQSKNMEKNQDYVKLYSLLSYQEGIINSPVIAYRINLEQKADLSSFITDKLQYILSRAWITLDQKSPRYLIDILKSGNYDLAISQEPETPLETDVDSKKFKPGSEIYLTRGVHRIELKYSEQENLLSGMQSGDQEYIFALNQYVGFNIKNFDSNSAYALSFDYEQIDGNPVGLSILQSKKEDFSNNFGLVSDTLYVDFNKNWNHFYKEIHPYPGLNYVKGIFVLQGQYGLTSHFQLRNIKLYKIYTPDLLFVEKDQAPFLNAPHISYSMVNPTKYVISVDNAKDKYALSFLQAFNPGWVLKYNGGEVNTNHFLLNGFGNVWLVDKKGSYKMTIEYQPQQFSYVGDAVSVASIIVIVFFAVKRRKKKYA